MISIIYTLSTLFISLEPLTTLLFNCMVFICEILLEDDSEVCKPSPIISNSKANKLYNPT